MEKMNEKKVIIIGAGVAGLSAAYHLLTISNIKPIIIEKDSVVGGLAKTVFQDGNGTDIGGHRFFSKNDTVLKLWKNLLETAGYPAIDDIFLNRDFQIEKDGANPETSDKVFLKRKRFSRIFYKKKFIDYPISLKSIPTLGIKTCLSLGFSWLKSCIFKLPETNLENFLINRFGKSLYKLFFEKYTEKVWGIHPSKISKDWGYQRIKSISLGKIITNAIFNQKNKKKEISLIEEYFYPKFGCSQLWEIMAEEITQKGGNIILDSEVTNLIQTNGKISSIYITNLKTQEIQNIQCDYIISSMPIKELLAKTNDVPTETSKVAENLQYRDYILVNFVCNDLNLKNNTGYPTVKNILPDSWIYLQDNDVKAGRFNIMNHFSPYVVNDFKNDFVVNLEYFCDEKDDFWQKTDEEIKIFAQNELEKLNISDKNHIKNTTCMRFKKAYPSYFGGYEHFDIIKSWINSIKNLYCIGRNGLHRYNNMDHSTLSGIEAAEILVKNLDKTDLWDINTDKEYQEIRYE